MSAAATAAGYLYASGRLRGRSAREQDHNEKRAEEKQAAPAREPIRQPIKVAVLPQQDEVSSAENPAPKQPRRTPKIEYRTRRRWSPA